MKRKVYTTCLFSYRSFSHLFATTWSQEKVDLETITRIRYEGFRNSHVMEFASGSWIDWRAPDWVAEHEARQ